MSSTHPAQALTLLVSIPLLLQGCMSDGAWDGIFDTADADDTAQSPADSDDDTSGSDFADPSWWSLSATVLMEDALPVQDDTNLVVALIDESADASAPICQATYSHVELTVQEVPDPSIYHWWQVSLGEPETECSAHLLERVPSTVELGLGILHPDIAALLEPAGYQDIESFLYGGYLRTEAQTIWTWGIAATSAGFDAEQDPVAEAPVPNGTYSFVPIYLLPLQGG